MADAGFPFLMPSLGADMEDGTLVEWLKHPGDAIARGDILAVVETEKGAIEIEIFADGTMQEILVHEGETVPVGAPLAMIVAPGGAVPPSAPLAVEPVAPATVEPTVPAVTRPEPEPEREPVEPVAAPEPSRPIVLPGETTARLRASPAARAFAQARGIDLASVTAGSGPDGAVLRSDLEAAAGEKIEAVGPAKPAKAKRGLDLDKMRHAIAAAMGHSKREIPHYYLGTRINLRRASDWLAETNRTRPPETRLLMNVLFLKAVAGALSAYPRFNGHYGEAGFTPLDQVHIGTAIAIRGGGLIAPAIHDCDRKTPDEIMTGLRDLVARSRTGNLRSSEITGAGITVTSLGERSVDAVYGVIFPPQVAIVGFGAPHLEPVAHADGALAAELVTFASLAADHRVTDGHMGGQFLNKIGSLLQEPEKL